MFTCENNKTVKAVASVTLNDEFAINKIRLIKRDNNDKLMVAMPSLMNNVGKYINYAHPLTNEVRLELEHVLLDKYTQMITIQNNN